MFSSCRKIYAGVGEPAEVEININLKNQLYIGFKRINFI